MGPDRILGDPNRACRCNEACAAYAAVGVQRPNASTIPSYDMACMVRDSERGWAAAPSALARVAVAMGRRVMRFRRAVLYFAWRNRDGIKYNKARLNDSTAHG
jgi:hypothetical protein